MLLSKHFQIGASTVTADTVKRKEIKKKWNHTPFVGCNLESRLPIRTRCISAAQVLIMSITFVSRSFSLHLCPHLSTFNHFSLFLTVSHLPL